MSQPDLNLLIALDALLTEGSVARAGRRLKLSPSAMSRTLARLRAATGDPLLVRAGRALVPTPHALALQGVTGQLVQEALAVLQPAAGIDLARLERTFILRTSDGFVDNFGAALIERVGQAAPGVVLCFVQKTDKDSAMLREGSVDLETGVVGDAASPELRIQALFRDRFIGVVRAGHALASGRMSVARYAAGRHIMVSRRRRAAGPVDEALAALNRKRQVTTIVGGYAAALALARGSDLIATVPERHTANLRAGMASFRLPVALPEMTVSIIWHPRMQADAGHRFLRECVRSVCAGDA